MSRPWVTKKWTISWRNFSPKRIENFSYPKKVRFLDMTLENGGENSPGVVFKRSEKIEIAQALVELGIKKLAVRAGYGAETRTADLLQREIDDCIALSKAGIGAELVAFCGSTSDIQLALRYGSSEIVLQCPSSEIRLKMIHSSKNRIIEKAINLIDYAKQQGLQVAFMPTDVTRSSSSFLRSFLNSVFKESKPNSVVVADTLGCTTPFGLFHTVEEVRGFARVPIELHCHKDFGMATANAFAGIAAGASIVHTTVNGMGERAGLVALEEISTTLKILRGIDAGIRYDKLCQVSRLVGSFANLQVKRNKPIVGEYAFAGEIDSDAHSLIELSKSNFVKSELPFLPEFVGNSFKLSMGSKGGPYGIKWKARQLGFTLSDEETSLITERVRSLAFKVRRPLTDQEFERLVKVARGPGDESKFSDKSQRRD